MLDRSPRGGGRAAGITAGLYVIALVLEGGASAMPASPHLFADTQPDGTQVELRLRGDEHFHWLEDSRGFTVVRERGRFVYGRRDAGGRIVASGLAVGRHDPRAAGLRRHLVPDALVRGESGASAPMSLSTAPAPIRSGTLRNLVVPIRFANHAGRALPTREALDVLFNRPGGDPVLAPTGSVRDVYDAGSYGQLTLDSTVLPWIDLPYTEQYYAGGNTYGRVQEAVRTALNILDQDPSVSLLDFDRNGDGAIDAITFIHSGYAAEWGGYDQDGAYYLDRIWSHKWAIGRWAGREGIAVTAYHISPALWGTSGSAIGRIGVISHELGHFLGLPDLYDTDYSGEGAGSYCLMANSWGYDGTQLHPPHLSAWSKAQLGWVTPSVIGPGTYALEAAEQSPSVYRIERGFAPGEYLLVENRQPQRFDAALAQGGLAVWHIDSTASLNDEGHPGQPDWPENGRHYRVALLQADGAFDLEQGTNRGDGGDLFHAGSSELRPDTVPNTDSYQDGRILQTGIELIGISEAGALMEFTYSEGAAVLLPDCSDGVDNERDGLADFPADPGCASVADDSEVDRPGLTVVPISGGSLRVAEKPQAPGRSGFRFKSADRGILLPAAGGAADPRFWGARLVLSNPRSGEVGEIPLHRWGWQVERARLRYDDGACSISLSEGRSLSVQCRGSLGGFTLDEAAQGELDVLLELGEGLGFCASFGGIVTRDRGASASLAQPGSFSAKGAPRPAGCVF